MTERLQMPKGLDISVPVVAQHGTEFRQLKQLQLIYEPRCEKTGFLHMRKQRRRSASR